MTMPTLLRASALLALAISAGAASAQTDTSAPAPAAMRTIDPGAEFAVTTGDTVGITRRSRVFAVKEIDAERGRMTWSVSDLTTGETTGGRDEEGELLVLDDECRLSLYDVADSADGEAPVASLLLMCGE